MRMLNPWPTVAALLGLSMWQSPTEKRHEKRTSKKPPRERKHACYPVAAYNNGCRVVRNRRKLLGSKP